MGALRTDGSGARLASLLFGSLLLGIPGAVAASVTGSAEHPPPLPGQAHAEHLRMGTLAYSTGEKRLVRGVVRRSDTGAPVPGVSVSVQVPDVGSRVLTNERGEFRLTDLETGPVSLLFRRLGFAEAHREVEVPASGTVRLEVSLEPAALALDPVSILLERTRMVGDPMRAGEIPGSAFHLRSGEIRSGGLAFDNVHDILRQVPGVNVRDEEGYGLRPHIGLRGVGNERSGNVTVMEDGVLAAPAPYSAPAAYHFPTAGRMEALEVRMGSSQIRYGPRTLGGAVNLISTGIPEENSWQVETAAGSDATGRAHLRGGGSTEQVGWLVETYQLRTDGFKRLESGGNTGFHTSDFLGKLRFDTGEDRAIYQELELKAGRLTHSGRETYLGLTEADFRSDPLSRYPASQRDRIDTDHRQIAARYFVRTDRGLDAVLTAYQNDFARSWYKLQSVMGRSLAGVLEDPGAHPDAFAVLAGAASDDDALVLRDNNREYLSRGVQSVLGWRFEAAGLEHDLEVGFRLHRDREDRFQQEDGYRMDGGLLVLSSEGAPGSQANRVGSARAGAAFVQNRIRRGPVTVTPGLRVERISFARKDYGESRSSRDQRGVPEEVRRNRVSAVIPGVGMTWQAGRRTHLFGGVHRGFGPPGPGADRETQVEESVNYEVGVRTQRSPLAVQASVYLSDYSNILGRSTLATGEEGTGELFNGGAVQARGLELTASWDPAFESDLRLRFPIQASYTWCRARFLTSFDSDHGPWGVVEEGDHLPYLPEHLFHADVSVEDPSWSVTLSARGNSRMRTEAGRGPIPDGRGADSFLVLNLSGEYDLPGWDGSIRASIQNLTDERYVVSRRPAGARPGLPRAFQLGVVLGSW